VHPQLEIGHHLINGGVKRVPELHQPLRVHQARNHVDDGLLQLPHFGGRKLGKHIFDLDPLLDVLLGDEDGVGAVVGWEVPAVLEVRALGPEEDGDAARHEGVEDRAAREAVAARLQTERRPAQEINVTWVMATPGLGFNLGFRVGGNSDAGY